MPLIIKAYALLGLLACGFMPLAAQTAIIIESQSMHPLQTMDARWHSTCNQFGYSSTIKNHSFLDNSCLIEQTDILIISSAIREFSAAQQTNILTFVESGGSLYIQSEYLFDYPGNKLFADAVAHFGDSFSWGTSQNGNIGPINVNSPINNNFNTINSVENFWYAINGSGTGDLTPFLEKDGEAFGFIYQPSTPFAGKIMTLTDQDWIKLGLGEELFENMVKYLPIPNTPNPAVVISTNSLEVCYGDEAIFSTTINNSHGATFDYQWQINGVPVAGAIGATYTNTTLEDGDVVECQINKNYGCLTFNHLSNPILMATIYPINTSAIEMNINQLTSCGAGSNFFEVNITNPDNINIEAIQWFINGAQVSNSNIPSISVNDLVTGDQILTKYSVMDPCLGLIWIEGSPTEVNIIDPVTPTVALLDPALVICEDVTTIYEIAGDHWGTSPLIKWNLDGIEVQNGGTTYEVAGLNPGFHAITVELFSTVSCVTTESANATPIGFEVIEAKVLEANLAADATQICKDEMVNFEITSEELGQTSNVQWYLDGVPVGDNSLLFAMENITDGQQVSATISTEAACVSPSSIDLDPIEITVLESETPYINIDTDATKVCPGTQVTLHASGDFWGDTPTFQWIINDVVASENNTSDHSLIINDKNTKVRAIVKSSLRCRAQDEATSEAKEILTNPVSIEVAEISAEHCGQQDGKITLNIDGGFGPLTYAWTNGNTTANLDQVAAGEYEITTKDNIGCDQSLKLTVPSEVGPEINEILVVQPNCHSEKEGRAEVSLTANSEVSIFWMNEQLDEVGEGMNASQLNPGRYEIEVIDTFGCLTKETFDINEVYPISLAAENEIIEATLGESVTLEPILWTAAQSLSFEWEGTESISCDTCSSATFTPTESGRYSYTVTNESGCSETGTIELRLKKDRNVYLPNAFSPDGDGSNDRWTVFAGEGVAKINSVSIFDRWGATLFQESDFVSNNIKTGWDGRFKGKTAQTGVYIASVEVTFIDGEVKRFNTEINLIR